MRQRWLIPAAVRAARRCATSLFAARLFFVAHLFFFALFAAQFLTAQVVGAQNPQMAMDRQILKIQGLIEHSNLPEAEKLLDNAVKQFPTDAGFDNLRGIIEAQKGDHAGAESSFRRAIQRSTKFTWPVYTRRALLPIRERTARLSTFMPGSSITSQRTKRPIIKALCCFCSRVCSKSL